MIRVPREGRFVEELVRDSLDVVVDSVAPLVGDDLLLACDLRFAQHEMLHPLGLEAHGQADAVGREKLVVVRPVGPGRRVGLGAALFELAIEGPGLELFRLTEHQVLEEVSEPGLAGPLVPRADVEPGVVRDDRRSRVDEDDDREPVAQTPALQRLPSEGDGSFVVELSVLVLRGRVRLHGPRAACGRRIAHDVAEALLRLRTSSG